MNRYPVETKERMQALYRSLSEKDGITNAASESLNAKIQWVKYTARGFRNFNNFVNAIYFHCGGRPGSRTHLKPGRRIQ